MRFSRDRRGQSVVIGTVILFGFLILALSLYQVQVVPQENAQVEFQHFEDVRNDLVDLRAGILQAGSTDRPQYQTVRLGTTYPSRVFTINPPSPAGAIQTSESYPIVISNGTPEGTVTVPTRFLQYRPGYNEIDRSSTWYDASVLYVDARDRGSGIAVIEDQELVSDDGEVRIVALQNEFRRSGTGRVTLELRPATNVTETLPEGPLTVTVPTRLSEDDWKDKTDLPTDSDVYGGVTDDANDDGVYNLTLDTTADDLTVDTVGVQEAPEEPTQNADGAVGGEGDGSDGSDGGGGGTGESNVEMRVDDLTRLGSNAPMFYVSYDVGVDFDEIRISAEDPQNEFGASDRTTSTDGRNGVTLEPGYDAGEEFAVTVTATEGGDVVAERTILTDADTRNPTENDDLSLDTSATLDASDITDRTQTNQNNVRYRFSYDVSGTGSFSRVQLHVLNRNGNGASGSRTLTQRSVNNADVNPGNGANTEYKLAVLVADADGVVVDDRIVGDVADNNGP